MQFDVYANKDRDTNKEFPYLLDIQSDTLKKLATRIVVPLTPSSMIKFPVKTLHLDITIKGKKYIAMYRDWETDRKSTRLNSSHSGESRMPSSA